MAEASGEDLPRRVRRAIACAVAAFLLLVTSLLTPWWVVSFRDASGSAYDVHGMHPLGAGDVLAHDAARWLTAGLVATTCALLFVRLAGRSWRHEPRSWRRDVWIAAGLGVAAVASALAWPRRVSLDEPAMPFWGGRTYAVLGNATGSFSETANPGLGWWLALSAVLLLAYAAWSSRRGGPPSPARTDK